MSLKKSPWTGRLAVLAVLLMAVVVIGGFSLRNYATPIQRTDIQRPLYTVGDSNYAVALNEGKHIVKFGRLPFGLYPGGLAFDDPQDASVYLRVKGKDQAWGVYQLSGDFDLDTKLVDGQRYTTVSLLVLRDVDSSDLSRHEDALD